MTARKPILDPVDRVSEVLFGLFMALTFVGAISVADSGREDVRSMFVAALGCNLAWGLVDAVMYLVGTITHRGRALALARAVRTEADAAKGRALVAEALSGDVGDVATDAELESLRARIAALPARDDRPRLLLDDWLGALGVFVLVVAATFPVALPFLLFDDLAFAKLVSRVLTLALLFLGGVALGRYAGYGGWKAGGMLTGLGVVLVVVIVALGG